MQFSQDFAELIDTAFPVWQRAFSKNPDDWVFTPDENRLVDTFVNKCVIEIIRQRKQQMDEAEKRIVTL